MLLDPEVVGFMGRWVYGSLAYEALGSWVVGFMGRWVHGSLDSWVLGFMGPWVHGSLGSWVVWFMCPWVHGSLGSWVVGFMGRRDSRLGMGQPLRTFIIVKLQSFVWIIVHSLII